MNNKSALVLGTVILAAMGLLAQSPGEVGKPTAGNQSPALKQVPPALETLNNASRQMYAGGRAAELAAIPATIVVSGDDLILRLKGQRTAATVIPPTYHSLKCVAHSMLALYAHLAHEPGKPLSEDRVKALQEYRELLVAAIPATLSCGYDPETLARQKRIIDRGLAFIDEVIKERQVSVERLTKFCRSSRPDVLANVAAAARAQLSAVHHQVMDWKKEMTPAQWDSLTVVILGRQTPRVENAAVQYFARLFGKSSGEGRRVVYAEGLGDEEQALNLVGTLRLDGKLSVAVFGDPFRMYRDLLADAARAEIDALLAAP